MRLGVLDVGSNTVHLLVVDAHPGARPLPAYSHKAELRLAELLDDDGAIRALTQGHKSLLAIGVIAVDGEFERGDVVACIDQQGVECGRGLINYSASDTRRIMRQPSSRIAQILGSMSDQELMHRDNMVFVRRQGAATPAREQEPEPRA